MESWENSEFAAPGQNDVQEGNYEVASEAYQEENPSGAAGQDYRKREQAVVLILSLHM